MHSISKMTFIEMIYTNFVKFFKGELLHNFDLEQILILIVENNKILLVYPRL